MSKFYNTLEEQIVIEEQALKDILKENIKKYRKRRSLSQFALASKIDLSTNFLADIEAGNTWVSAQTLIKLAKAFDIEVYELLKPENSTTSPEEQKEIGHTKKILESYTRDLAVVLKNSVDKSLDHLKKQYLTDK
jgi:transcriptional regulator with XRE-family HTH domain